MSQLNAKVVGKMEFAPGNFVLRVAPVGWVLPDFIPGQYGVLGLPGSAPRSPYSEPENPSADPDKIIRRAYSVASSSVSKEYVEFYISLVRSGALTPRLHNLSIGDSIWLGPKFTGLLTLERVPKDANVILIATGTGLAPYMSMVRTLVMQGGFDRHYAVIHGARHSWDLGYSSELQTLARISNKFKYYPVVSKPEEEPIEWNGPKGFIEDLWKSNLIEKDWKEKPEPANTHIFLCGNPLMIESCLKFLSEEGFKEDTKTIPGEIHLERFW